MEQKIVYAHRELWKITSVVLLFCERMESPFFEVLKRIRTLHLHCFIFKLFSPPLFWQRFMLDDPLSCFQLHHAMKTNISAWQEHCINKSVLSMWLTLAS